MITPDITTYNQSHDGTAGELCRLLMAEIEAALPDAAAKLFHGSPVWFLNDNPVVGYDVSAKGTNLLFWSGQSFEGAGLEPKGKHKAAGLTYQAVEDVDREALRHWLEQSRTIQWDYKNIRQNNGELHRL